MNAVDFVKKLGVDYAVKLLNYDQSISSDVCQLDFGESENLKQIVEAWELVHNFGGIKRAKRILKKAYTQLNTRVSVVWNNRPLQCTIEQLAKAINLVEQCQ